MGQNNGIEIAWSNEAFELWYLYHFQNVTTGSQENTMKRRFLRL